jgi:hypothetical protein
MVAASLAISCLAQAPPAEGALMKLLAGRQLASQLTLVLETDRNLFATRGMDVVDWTSASDQRAGLIPAEAMRALESLIGHACGRAPLNGPALRPFQNSEPLRARLCLPPAWRDVPGCVPHVHADPEKL